MRIYIVPRRKRSHPAGELGTVCVWTTFLAFTNEAPHPRVVVLHCGCLGGFFRKCNCVCDWRFILPWKHLLQARRLRSRLPGLLCCLWSERLPLRMPFGVQIGIIIYLLVHADLRFIVIFFLCIMLSNCCFCLFVLILHVWAVLLMMFVWLFIRSLDTAIQFRSSVIFSFARSS